MLALDNVKPVLTNIPDYQDLVTTVSEGFIEHNGKQRGDPKKLAEILVDVVKQEGRATGKGIPERLPLGEDAVQLIREKCERTLKLLKEWEEISCSTDF